MTSWRVTLLFLIVSFISLSSQNCGNYFDMAEWTGTNLHFSFHLANTTNPKDLIKCTLKDACEETKWKDLCAIQKSCFNGTRDEKNWTCRGRTSQNISFYHLMCLAAISLNETLTESIVPEGCDYENVCSLYHQISPDRIPTTAPTTVLPTTATVLSLTTPALPAPTGTTTVSLRECGGGNEKRITDTKDAWTPLLLIISASLNIVLLLLLLVFFLWLRQRTQDTIQDTSVKGDSFVLDETTMNEENHLMTTPDSHLINSPLGDTSRDGHTTGNRVRSQ